MKKQHGLAGTPKVVSGTFLFSFFLHFHLFGSDDCDTLCETPQGRGRPKKGGVGGVPGWGHGDGSTEVRISTSKTKFAIPKYLQYLNCEMMLCIGSTKLFAVPNYE